MYPYGLGLPFPDDDDEDDRDTMPPSPPLEVVKLQIKQESQLLFYSACWVIQAQVGGKIIYESDSSGETFSMGFIKQWARKCIRDNYKEFKGLGVDAETEYENWGGDRKDLCRSF